MTGDGSWEPPADFEEYRLVRPLGRGAMGEVYLAHDTILDRAVAVKFIATVVPDEAARRRFFVEARAIARLQHPNVVAIHRAGEVRRRPYLVSEYVRGVTLAAIERPLPWPRVLALGVALARGLAAAHRRGVLHRDIKPANAILSDDGEVKLLDFGLAKLVDRGAPAPAGATLADPAPAIATSPAAARERPIEAGEDTLPMVGADRGDPAVPGAVGGARPLPAGSPAPAAAGRSAHLTGAAFPIGTPLYMAPELWRGEPASPAADVYSLGIVLFELCAGIAPHHDGPLDELPERVVERDAPSLAAVVPGVDARLAAVVDRCLARDPRARYPSGDALREALEQLTPAGRTPLPPGGSPYRGLRSFEAEQRDLFFGRDEEVRAVVDRLRADPVVVVTGDSGVGKSSLCRAGVLPVLAALGFDPGGPSGEAAGPGGARVLRWIPGRRPLASLAAALAPVLAGDEAAGIRAGGEAALLIGDHATARSAGGEAALLVHLREEPSALARMLRRRAGDAPIVLFADQLEELVTLAAPDEAALVAEALGSLAIPSRHLRLLATARSDFLSRLAALPDLGPELSRALHLLRPLSPEGLREAVVGPARASGVRFESDALVDRLVASVDRTGGGLPLLQFALAELWDARHAERGVLPQAALDALGGVDGALARHADAVLDHLLPGERAAARSILTRLVTREGTRARLPETELRGAVGADPTTGAIDEGAARGALDALIRGRLIVARGGEDAGEGTCELAHEALAHAWGTLRGWLASDVAERAARQRLERAAADWERLGRPAEALWRDRQLSEVATLDAPSLGRRERDFLSTSRRARRRRRALRLAALAALPLCAALVYGGLRVATARQVGRHLDAARAALTGARARAAEVDALRRDAFAHFDGGRRQEGERRWTRLVPLAADLDSRYARAGQALDAALLVDAGHRDARHLLGEVLFERALLAERDHRPEQRAALVERMATYDDRGDLRRRLTAPARLDLVTTPPGARVSWQRYDPADGRRRLSPPVDLGATPLAGVALPPASYLLTVSFSDRPSVPLPLLAGRDERLHLALAPPARLPPGFVYVPPGRFLFGSADVEPLRRLLDAQPLHAAATGAFLIGRTEVTFADWLAFLAVLPPEERARRRPHLTSGTGIAQAAALSLDPLPGGAFHLTFRPTEAAAYDLRLGEPLHYPARDHRALQDSARLPVIGVSADDAVAYAAWLDASGRVPGARLCDEREWERAARGADDRLYPHGDRLAPDDANHDATYGRRPGGFGPDEAGAHPASDSPYGVADLAGNVWEFARSVDSSDGIVARGGSWYQDEISSQSTNRARAERTMRTVRHGVRLCATPR